MCLPSDTPWDPWRVAGQVPPCAGPRNAAQGCGCLPPKQRSPRIIARFLPPWTQDALRLIQVLGFMREPEETSRLGLRTTHLTGEPLWPSGFVQFILCAVLSASLRESSVYFRTTHKMLSILGNHDLLLLRVQLSPDCCAIADLSNNAGERVQIPVPSRAYRYRLEPAVGSIQSPT